jgi:prepilin-type N-terminal cleavage/methylation domain-containing protein
MWRWTRSPDFTIGLFPPPRARTESGSAPRCRRPSDTCGVVSAPRSRARRSDGGFSLIEVVIALTLLTVMFLGVGRLMIASLTSSQQAKLRTEAAAIVTQQDSSLEHLPSQVSLAAAQAYVATLYNGVVLSVPNGTTGSLTKYTATTTTGSGSSANLMAVTLVVSWPASIHSATLNSLTSQIQVPFS